MPALDYEQEQCASESEAGSSLLLQSQRQELHAEIQRAKSIPKVHGREGLYSEETLDRAIAFLRAHIERLWQSYGVKAPMPVIGPGPNRSVDLFWETPPWQLLVNIPASTNTLATFYGHDQNRQKIKGSFDPQTFSFSVAACLMV